MSPFLHEGRELVGESGKTYLAVSRLGQDNVWTGVEKDNYDYIFILKTPSQGDTPGTWPNFIHEMIMHELFKSCPSIRQQVDRIPPSADDSQPPILVLEILETTVWQARTQRPFSREEIVAIIKGILEGLRDIHSQGLVYGDLKMENILLSGFDADNVSSGDQFVVKLGDLGSVLHPTTGTVQPLAYRAPEVYFLQEIIPAADIWAVGLIYSHLLEAQSNFQETGLYDNLYFGSGIMDERVRAMRYAIANDYDLRHDPYYKDCTLPYRDKDHAEGNHWENLRKKGLDELDVEFLQRILKANPTRRPSARAILASQWIAGGLLARKFARIEMDGTNDASTSLTGAIAV